MVWQTQCFKKNFKKKKYGKYNHMQVPYQLSFCFFSIYRTRIWKKYRCYFDNVNYQPTPCSTTTATVTSNIMYKGILLKLRETTKFKKFKIADSVYECIHSSKLLPIFAYAVVVVVVDHTIGWRHFWSPFWMTSLPVSHFGWRTIG